MHDQLALGINVTVERSVPPFGLCVPIRDRQWAGDGGRRLARKALPAAARGFGEGKSRPGSARRGYPCKENEGNQSVPDTDISAAQWLLSHYGNVEGERAFPYKRFFDQTEPAGVSKTAEPVGPPAARMCT
jgi:hypothetical protein